jgi:multicomponent Na+:H+ antiporter subunit A
MQWHEAGLAALLVAAIGAVVHSRTKLAAVAGLGVVGYGIALVFVFFGAPDLAMTQFVIETLTVILFVLVFYHLPSTSLQLPSPVAARNLVVAIALGLLMSILVLVAADSEGHPRVADYFVEHSLDLAHGRNIVNVILVDFRGIDTMGEITVLGVAGVGAFALLKLRLGRRSGP